MFKNPNKIISFMRKTTIQNLLLVLVLVFTGVACDDSSIGAGEGVATVEGQVESMNSGSETVQYKSVEGAVVTAARVTFAGELEPIGETETVTGAEGRFTLEIENEAFTETADRIVIVAENNGETAKTFVSGQLESGGRVEVHPITFESSAEAEVFQHIVSNGDVQVVAKADIEAMVNNRVATDIENNADRAAMVASALSARAEAEVQHYSELGIELTEEQISSIQESKAQAQAEFEAQLNATADADQREEAFEQFLEAVAKADMQAEVQATAVAKASESSARVLVKHSAGLSSEAKAEIHKYAAYMTTFALESAVQEQLQTTADAESTVESVADAAVALRSEIKEFSNATEEEVRTAFEAFNTDIITILESDPNIQGELFASANTIINQDGGVKAMLESSIKATLQLSLILDAYLQFSSEVGSVVDNTFSNINETEAEAYTQLLILINIAT